MVEQSIFRKSMKYHRIHCFLMSCYPSCYPLLPVLLPDVTRCYPLPVAAESRRKYRSVHEGRVGPAHQALTERPSSHEALTRRPRRPERPERVERPSRPWRPGRPGLLEAQQLPAPHRCRRCSQRPRLTPMAQIQTFNTHLTSRKKV